MSVDEIRQVAQTADQEVATVILLDQIPRNVFRGMDAGKVGTSTVMTKPYAASAWRLAFKCFARESIAEGGPSDGRHTMMRISQKAPLDR
jgi:uncharacterized protein (DUF924 family)